MGVKGRNWSGVEPPLSLQPRLPHGLHCVISSQVRACGQWPAALSQCSSPCLPGWGQGFGIRALGSGLYRLGSRGQGGVGCPPPPTVYGRCNTPLHRTRDVLEGGGGALRGWGGGRKQVSKRSTHARPGMHMQQCSAVPQDRWYDTNVLPYKGGGGGQGEVGCPPPPTVYGRSNTPLHRRQSAQSVGRKMAGQWPARPEVPLGLCAAPTVTLWVSPGAPQTAHPVHPLGGSVMGWRETQATRPTDSPSSLSVGHPRPAAGARSTGHGQNVGSVDGAEGTGNCSGAYGGGVGGLVGGVGAWLAPKAVSHGLRDLTSAA